MDSRESQNSIPMDASHVRLNIALCPSQRHLAGRAVGSVNLPSAFEMTRASSGSRCAEERARPQEHLQPLSSSCWPAIIRQKGPARGHIFSLSPVRVCLRFPPERPFDRCETKGLLPRQQDQKCLTETWVFGALGGHARTRS